MAAVLIADDDPDILAILEIVMSRAGHEVHLAHDGREAAEALARSTFDVAVLDVMMPHLSGLEVLAACRAAAHTRTLPVVLLSACSQPDDVAAGLAAGADRYLAKPFSPREVARVVGELAAGRRA